MSRYKIVKLYYESVPIEKIYHDGNVIHWRFPSMEMSVYKSNTGKSWNVDRRKSFLDYTDEELALYRMLFISVPEEKRSLGEYVLDKYEIQMFRKCLNYLIGNRPETGLKYFL